MLISTQKKCLIRYTTKGQQKKNGSRDVGERLHLVYVA